MFRGNESNAAIVGAKFNEEKNKHIITYFLDMKDLDYSIDLLSETSRIIYTRFHDSIDKATFDDKEIFNKVQFKEFSISNCFKTI